MKLAALATVTAVLCVLIREKAKPLSLGLSLLACVGMLLLGLKFLSPLLSMLEQLQTLSGLRDSVTAPLFKVVGIGILTQISSGVCQDAGEGALSKTVELAGSFLAIYASLPLLSAVLELLQELL